ncbi:MAG: DUF1080 domain-containing protein [Gemmataceae bacterium]|nr:DUF1080 domain-containing protein [Gemmataceae bacterium]
MIPRKLVLPVAALLLFVGGLQSADKDDGWIVLFNGKDTTGWKLKSDKYTVTRFVDAEGKEIKGAKRGKLDQKDTIVDAKGKAIDGAKIAKIDGKDTPVDADGKPIKDAKITKTGGRDAILSAEGKEIKDAKAVTETMPNPTGGWKVENMELICGNGPHGSDIFTEQKFIDFELHVEFQGNSNSGVYLQGRYEIQVDNNFGEKAKVVEKDGKKVEEFRNTLCGAIYGRIAPSKNMCKPKGEWQTYDVTFRAARGEGTKVTEKARVTVVWNGEKVIDNAEIDGATGSALDGKVLEGGPLMLQGDHGKVPFRNIKIKPLNAK